MRRGARRKLPCHECGGPSKQYKQRPAPDGEFYERWYRCEGCDARWRTVEVYAETGSARDGERSGGAGELSGWV